jgi:transcriptional regulator with XRE-family HTH domain/hemerythrin superfamily protein
MVKDLFALKFRKVLNDLKRRPEDAAKDLNISIEEINKILSGEVDPDFRLLKQATKIWPVNLNDFFGIEDDTINNYKIFTKADSDKTIRVMQRKDKPYYKYKDTVMSKISPFRPEWIEELVIVNDSSPDNPNVIFNNGHFLHQFTYFIGPVNFYYIDENGKKNLEEMNTGDSMYISPYTPHSFTTRKNKENKLGLILALTYTDKVDNEVLNELSVIGNELAKKYLINYNNEINGFKKNLQYYLNLSSLTEESFEKINNINLKKIYNTNSMPSLEDIEKITSALNINLKDLIPNKKFTSVKIGRYEKSLTWHYPSEENHIYKFVELTNVNQLPCSKALELTIVLEEDHETFLEVPAHQYLYNIGETDCVLETEKIKQKFSPGDSIYLKPNVKHKFSKKSKILILRIGGKIYGENLFHISSLSEKNFERLINDNKPWFN